MNDAGCLIGGDFSKAKLSSSLLSRGKQELTKIERDKLWRIFQNIGLFWNNLHHSATDSANLKSSWLEFVVAKTESEPSYVAEYSNAVSVVDELIEIYGEETAFKLLFIKNGIPDDPPVSRIAHAKKFVVDEFIHVNVVASGFKHFGDVNKETYKGGKNYKGYLGGSRYKNKPRVRAYTPASDEEAKQ